ncbi:hypothetical protein ABZ777_27080 [Micromonospora parva]|uniref:hypothetical protein n=1 Tax=Micromonospora parva TaxID=1464048 RepID=UPI0034101FFC
MPPPRRPRSWLAGRLRSAAGAVQRLAGRVEPDGHLPSQSPLSQPPVATPRRFGEPPRHWLDLVAEHAPGLLHDLDLDPSPADAEARDGQPGGSTGRDDTAALDPGTFSRFPGSGRAGGRDGEVDAGGPASAGGGTGRRGRGPRGDTRPTRSPAEHRSGRSVRPSPAGDQPDGTRDGAAGTWAGAAGTRAGAAGTWAGADGRSGGASPSRSDTTSPPTGATWPDLWAGPSGPHVSAEPTSPDAWAGPTGPHAWAGPTGSHVWAGPTGPDPSAESAGPVGSGAAVPPVRPASRGTAVNATALDASGLPRSAAQPVRSMVFRAQSPPGSRPHRPEPEPTPATARPPWPGAVDHGPGRSAAPLTADRSTGGRDGSPDDSDGPPRPGTDQRGGAASAAARSAGADSATWSGRPAWPDLDGADASGTGRTATDGRDTPTTGRGDMTGVGDRWLDLPGERARSGRRAALPDPGWDRVGGGRATRFAPPPVGSARGDDPWPPLPDDSALWSVAGPALDTAQLTRLDREQAGD